jgi:hypothetical protein
MNKKMTLVLIPSRNDLVNILRAVEIRPQHYLVDIALTGACSPSSAD